MKIIQNGGGFTTDELNSYKYVIFSNLVTQMKVIVNAASRFNIEVDSKEAKVVYCIKILSSSFLRKQQKK